MISTADLAKKEFTGITLPDPYGNMLGKIPMDASAAVWGPKGSGKSTLAVDLAYVLANEMGKGIYCSSEEGPGPSMQNKISRLGAEHDDLMVTDFEGLEDLRAAVKYSSSKFLILDSASMGYVKLKEFEAFHDWCKEQDIMLFYILHATKDGNYKGNTMMVHMPDIEIKVEDGIAVTEKNRFKETPREMEVVFERGKREKADGKGKKAKGSSEKATGSRENPVDESMLHGIPYIENPSEELRENKSVKPDEIYQMVTDMIINTIEDRGHLPWQKEWDDSGLSGGKTATNFVSGNAYRGINFFMLNFRQVFNEDGELTIKMIDFDNPYFLTFNQVEDLGGKVKEGSNGWKVMYFTKLYKIEQEDPEIDFGTYSLEEMTEFVEENYDDIKRTRGRSPEQIARSKYLPILKYYNVFHASDIEGIDWGELPKNENADKSAEFKIEIAKSIYENYPNAPEVKHVEPRAYYQPDVDFINMPPLERFDEEQFYHTTLFHEAVHSTGHKSRLNRNLKGGKGKREYAKEELIAEMGAVFLCSESGILFKTIDNSAKYLQTWNKRLVGKMKNDNRFFFRAASRAQAAADHILDRDDEGIPAYRSSLSDSRENPTTDTQCLVNAKAKTNEEKNGIEIQFSDAPPKYVRDRLKEHGFTYYAPNDGESFWAAEKTARRKKFIESIAGEFDKAVLGWKKKEEDKRQTADAKSEKADDSSESDTLKEPKESDLYTLGDKTTVDFKADGSIQETGHYAIVEAADLIPSHNKDCTPNSEHKISKGQPRDRSLDALCNQPKFIAQNLNPSSITKGNLAFNGAPTTLPDIQHIQGNGRGIALKITYDEYPENAKKYKNYLTSNAGDWGFTKSQITEYEEPVLVRILDVSDERAVELGNVVDTSQAKMSKVDQGKAYIRNLPKQKKQAVGNLIDDSSGETLGQVIDDVGLRIMDQFKDLDRQELVEDNSLTSEGKDFLRSVFAGLVFDSDENKQALQHFLNLKHTQQAGLKRAYGNIIPFIDTKADITPTIQKAVEIVSQVQQTDGIETVQDYLNQSDAFTGANADRFSEQEAQLAEYLLDADTQKFIRNGFRMYQWKVNGREDLFNPIEKVSPEQAFEAAFVERLRINPTRVNPGDPLIYIGETETIQIDSGNGIKAIHGTFPTFVSDNKLYIVPEYRIEEVYDEVDEEEAVEGFEEWHNYEADETDIAIEWPDDEEALPAGTAHKIWYASDKVMQAGDAKGEINHYVHDFDAGKRPAVVKGDILIVGNIKWNRRGLLN